MDALALNKLIEWLIDGARSAPSPPAMMAETCERLGEEVVVGSANYEMLDSEEFRASPLAIVFGEGREVRSLIDGPGAQHFPLFDDLRAEGITDYIALPLLNVDGSVHASSWTTKQPGGFTDAQLKALRGLIPPLSRLIAVTRLRFM